MKITARVEGDGGVRGVQYGWGIRREHILFDMQSVQMMTLTQGLTAGDQHRIVFNASQLLPGTQQAPSQMPFAGAPIQPMRRLRGKG